MGLRMTREILRIEDLGVVFHTEDGTVRAVDGVSLRIRESEILGIVGESGSGKSVTALSIMRLVPRPPGQFERGTVAFEGQSLLDLPKKAMRQIRGNKISMIFQEPMSSLNPVFSVGDQISESLRLHQGLSKKEAWRKSIALLQLVGIPSPEERVRNYPHQLSGGMCQRVMIAVAIACQPKLMLADEPTTALDVTIQKQILRLMREMRDEFGTAILFITHNLGVIAEMAQNVVVMYAGKIVEASPVTTLFTRPLHPYTVGLIKAIPRPDRRRKRLSIIAGIVPSLFELPPGCSFHNRCEKAFDRCADEPPPLFEIAADHACRCWLYA
jgi:oligopeptide/dipeptide ABC transporter ATP-binding protein